MTRTIRVEHLGRVEGEGGLTIRLRRGVPVEVRLELFEPPRFFEGFLRGRSYLEVPDLTARICGICPVAYQMSSAAAIEDALGLRVSGPTALLRQLLYCGEWIESHALHVFLLHAPDFLGLPDAIAMAREHGEWVRRGLRIKQAGNALVALIGGREIHPVNVRVGGFYRAPAVAELAALRPALLVARDDAEAALDWLCTLPMPELACAHELVALHDPAEYAMCGGRLVSTAGLDIDVSEFLDRFEEAQVPHSTALHAQRKGGGRYLTGPLARFHLNFEQLAPGARAAARRHGLEPPVAGSFRSILVRMLEVLHALERACALIEAYTPPAAPSAPAPPRAGVGHGATEAPRGTLYHRYALDAEGTVAEARIVPPTAQNQPAIEAELWALAPRLAAMPRAAATHLAEHLVRNFDPCISCATHFLDLRVEEVP